MPRVAERPPSIAMLQCSMQGLRAAVFMHNPVVDIDMHNWNERWVVHGLLMWILGHDNTKSKKTNRHRRTRVNTDRLLFDLSV